MSVPASSAQQGLALASEARKAGRVAEAAAKLREIVGSYPDYGPAWNLLGLTQLESGQIGEAVASLRKATELDPVAPFPPFNLSRAQRAAGDRQAELQSLGAALSRDPYFLPAVLAKGETLQAVGRSGEAIELYRLLFAGLPEGHVYPEPLSTQLEAARQVLRRHSEQDLDRFSAALREVAAEFPTEDLRRARGYAEQRAGQRKVYQHQPTAGHFPYLPALEFFDPELFPWLRELERQTDAIRTELLNLWATEDPNFRPYVTYAEGVPLNDWAELNWSPRWSAWFLWENGERNHANCARCPNTAAVLDALPMLDIPGKGPTAMFSVLQPHTRIPPHTGSTNARTTIHLPLVVPPDCGFRVGSDTREWVEGVAWAFDDTIEHEAWNNSDRPRAILIVDGWNPLLSEAERELVRRIG